MGILIGILCIWVIGDSSMGCKDKCVTDKQGRWAPPPPVLLTVIPVVEDTVVAPKSVWSAATER